MSTAAERRANEQFDKYVTEVLSGKEPVLEDFLSRCPDSERARFEEAVRGFRFAHENVCSYQVDEKSVAAALDRVRKARARCAAVIAARERSAAESWDTVVTRPLQRLAALLYPDKSESELARVGILNRRAAGKTEGRTGTSGTSPLTEYEKRAIELLARQEAAKLLERVGIADPPVSLLSVAEQLSLLVIEARLQDLEGCLVTDGETGGILLNEGSPELRRRFTLAHEIAHFVLHRKSQGVFSDREGEIYSPASRIEFEASALASHLLMPTALLPPEFGREMPSFHLADKVAADFDVSLMAALRRLVRESHHRTAFINIEGNRVNWREYSPEITGFNWIADHVPAGSAAHRLITEGVAITASRVVPADLWFERGDIASENAEVVEESRFFPSGHAYVLISVIEK